MKKGLVLGLILGSLLINFVSATSYGSFSFRSILDMLDPLMLLFVILFAVVNFSLSRFFKHNVALSVIISLAISLLMIYGIYQSGFNVNIENFLYDYAGEDVIYIVLPILVAAISILLAFKFGVGLFLMGIGGFLLVVGFFDWVYERLPAITFGVILIILGFWLWRRKKKRESLSPNNLIGGRGPSRLNRAGTWAKGWPGRYSKGRDWKKQKGAYDSAEAMRKANEEKKRIEDDKYKKYLEQKRIDEDKFVKWLLSNWKVDQPALATLSAAGGNISGHKSGLLTKYNPTQFHGYPKAESLANTITNEIRKY